MSEEEEQGPMPLCSCGDSKTSDCELEAEEDSCCQDNGDKGRLD